MTCSRRLVLATGLALAPGAVALAESLRVELEWRGGASAATAPRICAMRSPPAATVETRCDALVGLAPSGTLDLPAGSWRLRADADGIWSTTTGVDVLPGAPATARVTLWPSAVVQGSLVPIDGSPAPAAVDVRFQASTLPEGGAPDALLAGRLRCPLERARWRCAVPAAALDVELRAEGFVPHYLWDVALAGGGEKDVGLLSLRRGASIAGHVVRADGSVPKGPCAAEVRIPPAPGARAGADLRFSTSIDARGFFQLVGVPPGERLLAVACPVVDAAKAVSVRADAETRLQDPLLAEGLTLEVQVVPALDPQQRPWRLDVFRFPAERQQIAVRESVSAAGSWSRRGLVADTYQVDVVDEAGAQWQSQPLVLRETSGRLVVQVPTLKIGGRVRLGAMPLRARLVFTNDAGSMRLVLQSDDDGVFQGHAVSAHEAWERGWTVQVQASSPPVSHRLEQVVLPGAPGAAEAWLDIQVPGASARGLVLSEDGKPQPGAQVLCASLDDAAQTYAATSDEHGTFELLSLPPGRYRLSAETDTAFSEAQELSVGPGAEPEVKLVLRPQLELAGQIVSAAGPLAGATVHLWLAPGIARGSTTTDEHGRFELGLPADATEAGVTVAARGYALRMTRVRVVPRRALTLSLSKPAGTLVLLLPARSKSEEPPPVVLLAHDESIESLDTLAAWGAENGGGQEGERIVVPNVEPGSYSLCRLPAREIAALWQGAVAPELCAQAQVAAGALVPLALRAE